MRQTVSQSDRVASTKEYDQSMFLVVPGGGAGKTSTRSALRHHQAAGAPFPMETFALDTDPDGLEAFDGAVHIAPSPDKVSAMASNPERYGPACQALVRHHRHLLDPETLGRGARTHRILTQAGFELFQDAILEGLRKRIHSLLKRGRGGRILIVLAASLGGGTGSAVTILLLNMLLDPLTRDRLLLGLSPELLARPVAFVIDPYAHALQQTNDIAPHWILANIYATRTELAEYEKQDKGYQYVFHMGLGNNAGAVFPTIDQVCEANGMALWSWMANYAYFKSRAADQLDFYIKSCRYQGDDRPERRFPRELWAPYACDSHEPQGA